MVLITLAIAIYTILYVTNEQIIPYDTGVVPISECNRYLGIDFCNFLCNAYTKISMRKSYQIAYPACKFVIRYDVKASIYSEDQKYYLFRILYCCQVTPLRTAYAREYSLDKELTS